MDSHRIAELACRDRHCRHTRPGTVGTRPGTCPGELTVTATTGTAATASTATDGSTSSLLKVVMAAMASCSSGDVLRRYCFAEIVLKILKYYKYY